MNEKEFENWVTALESGDIKQGKYRLRNENDSMCCMGILCNIVDPNGWRKDPGQGWTYSNSYKFIDAINFPPSSPEFLFIWEIILSNGAMLGSQLSYMNDVDEKTFPEIAAWLREHKHLIVKK